MREIKTIGLAAAIAALFVAAYAVADPDPKNERDAMNLTRACIPAVDGSAITLAATTSADADSGALERGSVYMLQCDTAAWLRWSSAAGTAAADDWLQPAGIVSFFATGGREQDAIHLSALSQTADGDCRLLRCY